MQPSYWDCLYTLQNKHASRNGALYRLLPSSKGPFSGSMFVWQSVNGLSNKAVESLPWESRLFQKQPLALATFAWSHSSFFLRPWQSLVFGQPTPAALMGQWRNLISVFRLCLRIVSWGLKRLELARATELSNLCWDPRAFKSRLSPARGSMFVVCAAVPLDPCHDETEKIKFWGSTPFDASPSP